MTTAGIQPSEDSSLENHTREPCIANHVHIEFGANIIPGWIISGSEQVLCPQHWNSIGLNSNIYL